jgi:HPt (histidine-containing phosphotransfer) domain-containing protein
MAGITEDTLISEFVAESRDHLDSLEPDLLLMEQEGENVSSEVVNRAFRAIHSIKGSSSVLGFDSLMKLSHIMENLLMQIRNKKMIPDADSIDALLQSGDKLSYMIDDVHASNQVDCTEEIKRLNDILTGQSQSESSSAPPHQQSPEIQSLHPSLPEKDSNRKDSESKEIELPVSNEDESTVAPEKLTVRSDDESTQIYSEDSSEQDNQTQSLEPEVLSDISLEEENVTQELETISDEIDTKDQSGTENIVLTDNYQIHIDIHGPDHMLCNFNPEKLLDTYHEEKQMYAIWIYGATDLVDKNRTPEEFLNDMISFGTYLYSDFTDADKKQSATFHMLIFTILDKNLLVNAIDIPDEQVHLFPSESIQALIQQIKSSQPEISSARQVEKKLPAKTQKDEQPKKVSSDRKIKKTTFQDEGLSDGAIISETSAQDLDSRYLHISKLKSGTGLKLEASGPDKVTFEIDNKKVSSIVEKKKKLFVVWVNPQKDLIDKSADMDELVNDIKSLGECITHDFDRNISDSKSKYYHMLVASIMEKELLCNGLDFPKNQIAQFVSKDLLNSINQTSIQKNKQEGQIKAAQDTKTHIKAEPQSQKEKKLYPTPKKAAKHISQKIFVYLLISLIVL